ncbi:PAS domain S-box protein [Microcoleus sp. FACHB-1515]|uniref:PAS domain S-box protein n=1 Tax=Cyanophyceae TaxID=3028117 RepID=UPI001687597C|nr:PAS domain S-box protein [Microcoleus sp. FACHB-1515]MBD2091552.1 PAS domain S-box protein [Microcoleus sp. FACHB-1515]
MPPNSEATFQRRLLGAIALPIVLLVLLTGLSIWQTIGLLSEMQWVDHTDQVISQANRVQKLLLDQETGIRGYLIAGEAEFLEPYEQGRSQIEAAIDQLADLVSDNPPQVEQVNQLELQQAAWHEDAVRSIQRKQQGGTEPIAELRDRKRQMDVLRSRIARFINIEEQLPDRRVQTVQQTARRVIATRIGLGAIVGAMLAYFSGRQLQKVAQTFQQILRSLQQSLAERDVAEAALRASEERFRRAILAAPLPIMLHTETGEVVQINRQWTQITGYTIAEIPTIADWTDRAYGDRKHQARADIARLYDLDEAIAEGEAVVTTRSGDRRTWEFFSAPVGQLSSGDRLVISTAIDITDRLGIEQQIRESYNLLQTFIESTTDAIFIKDRSGRCLLLNERTAQILGGTKSEILGKDEYELLPPDIAQAVQEADRQIMNSGRGQTFEEQIPEHGELRTFLSTKDPYRNAQGQIAGVIGISRDITDRKRAEEKLMRSTQRLRALQDIDHAILRVDSPAEIAQAALDRLQQIIQCDQAAVVLFDFEAETLEVLAGAIENNLAGSVLAIADSIDSERLRQRPNLLYIEDLAAWNDRAALGDRLLSAGYRSFLAMALLLENRLMGDLLLIARSPHAFSAEDQEIVQEVTNQLAIAIAQSKLRHQLQQYAAELEQRVADRTAALAEMNQELEAFTYSVSHDLRAPLRTMQGFAQALLEDYGGELDEFGKSYIESIVEDATQMESLIADLLSYSRLTRAQISPHSVNLDEVVTAALNQIRTQIEEKQAKVSIASPLGQVFAHRPTLVQGLVNLISNAIKFVESGVEPQIAIRSKSEQKECDWIRLEIVDNGLGIAPEHQERIFRVFERLHGVETYPGTGIGLAIVRKGIDRMGGRVGVESGLGQGSCFWMALPKAVQTSTVKTHDAPSDSSH